MKMLQGIDVNAGGQVFNGIRIQLDRDDDMLMVMDALKAKCITCTLNDDRSLTVQYRNDIDKLSKNDMNSLFIGQIERRDGSVHPWFITLWMDGGFDIGGEWIEITTDIYEVD